MQDLFTAVGIMAWPLFGVSVLALAIVLERITSFSLGWVHLQQIKQQNSDFNQQLQKKTQPEQREQWCQLYLQDCLASWRKRLTILSLLGTLSPLMGLLGTVWGLVLMFRKIAQTQQAVTPALLADGLWEAMYSTMAGLMIAIPCLLLSGVFNTVLERMQTDLTRIINHLNYQLCFDEAANA
ncbi:MULTISPECIES: MotA/TolQ/ExbB proton channel family protein [Pseudoalteromonas]|uniref:MotA/TolQ/ExbB proton channel family protein n=1 Tax=Pseudoalteromonas haloplanktis TaxID=228 RepID=A0ABU1B779_PSEHA|nr:MULTISPECIES: MotA/TolQ/ExbB proton channel family protein [Pseudoalteromonas]MCF6146260.1 biopolymer transport protein ExbB [Pseudoalteromonas mariniglutinosa NCIMB 1770]MDQ9090220.1 MotA/TolQ/ExbB proton channel family protein [Pseudoalteromonas haloplanktis]TMN71944.1 MotA/TolQ/ExbB proton channel family protein [Pseudoalteromonas sp. S1727]